MKFEILHAFRDWLNQQPDMANNTKKKYYQSVKNILAPVDFTDVSEIPAGVIESGVRAQKTRNDVSAAKRGLELFAEFAPGLKLPGSDLIGDINKKKRNYRKRRFKPLDLRKVQHTVNGLKDEKLKLGYRLMLATGARVSEVEQIRKQDITLEQEGGGIKIHVEHTKSGGPATLICDDPYLLDKLPAFIAGLQDGNRVFHSADTMIHKATEYGFQCHDHRRVYAKMKYKEIKAQRPELKPSEIVEEVRPLMRHNSSRTTKWYLGRKIIW